MNYWWVFEGKWFEKEHIGGYIHAPQYGKNGSNAPFHWKNVSEVRKGDYILSYLKMYINVYCGYWGLRWKTLL